MNCYLGIHDFGIALYSPTENCYESDMSSGTIISDDVVRAYRALLSLGKLIRIVETETFRNARGDLAYSLLWELTPQEWQDARVCRIVCEHISLIARDSGDDPNDRLLRLIAFSITKDRRYIEGIIGSINMMNLQADIWRLLECRQKRRNESAVNLAFLVADEAHIQRIMDCVATLENGYSKSVLLSTIRQGCPPTRSLRPYVKRVVGLLRSQSYPLKIVALAFIETCAGKDFVMPSSELDYSMRIKAVIDSQQD